MSQNFEENCLCETNRVNKSGRLLLLFDDINPKVRSVRLLINKLNLNVDYQYIDLIKGDHLTEEFKKVLIYVICMSNVCSKLLLDKPCKFCTDIN